jgi:hypothetical protein
VMVVSMQTEHKVIVSSKEIRRAAACRSVSRLTQLCNMVSLTWIVEPSAALSSSSTSVLYTE